MKVKNKNILKFCKLIILKLNASKNIVSCKPCSMCLKIINKYKITKVFICNNRIKSIDI
jgi:tRNA(Arg) A34 adenosine deaminase TadA